MFIELVESLWSTSINLADGNTSQRWKAASRRMPLEPNKMKLSPKAVANRLMPVNYQFNTYQHLLPSLTKYSRVKAQRRNLRN